MVKQKQVFEMITVFLSLLLILLTRTVMAPCKHGIECVKSTQTVQIISGVIIIIYVIDIIQKRIKDIYIYILGEISSVFTILIPAVVIGGCEMNTMTCKVKTFPSIYIVSSIQIILSTVFMIRAFLIRRNDNRA